MLAVDGDANAEAIAAAIMLDKSLHIYTSMKSGKVTHCWHIAVLLCMCLSTQSASSSCERIGSLLHNLEDGESRISAGRIADRLRLKVAGVEAIGGARDELLISNIVETLSSFNKDPLIQKAAMAKRRKKGQEVTGSLSRFLCASRNPMIRLNLPCSLQFRFSEGQKGLRTAWVSCILLACI